MASVLDLVKHYQHAIEKYPNDEQKVLKSIDKLFGLGVTVQHLQETGVGRTVNALRKEPGDVGQAARALVYKWKVMVAAEESDHEADQNNDTTNCNGYGNGKDSDDNTDRCKSGHNDASERSSKSIKKSETQMNGNTSGSKRKYHSSEEEDNSKKSKHSGSSELDEQKRPVKIKQEQSESDEHHDSEGSQSSDSDSELSESSEDGSNVNQKIKTEPTESHKSPSTKHSSHKHNYVEHKHESQSSKKSSESDKVSISRTSESRHSSNKSSSRERSQSSQHKSSTDKEISSERKHKSDHSVDKDKKREDTSSSAKHKSSSDKHRSSSDKHSSQSEKHTSSSGSHKSSSQKDKSDKHREQHDKSEKHNSKSDKHSNQAYKSDKEKHNSSSKTTSSDKDASKHKSRESSSSSREKHSSSGKEKSKDRSSSSKKPCDSNKSDKKTTSYDNKSKSDSKDKKSDERSSQKKSKSKSSSSSSHRSEKSSSREGVPKKKSQINNSVDSDDGIDCGSGASFAEALGMASPAKPRKKTISVKEMSSPNSFTNDLSPATLLAPTAKLAPLPALEISALPEISPNYRPRPPPRLMPHFTDDEAMSAVISSKNQRTKVYSGNKVIGKIPTLYELCVQVLQEHIDALEFTGGVPYEILKPIVDKATPQQLFMLEYHNPYLTEDTDHLWKAFCEKHFRNKKRQEMEAWREMFMRCQEEQEDKLKSLTANIRMTQEAKKAPIKQTKMAYVDSVVKPPRNIARKQAQHGTAFASTASPAARVAALASAPNVLRGGARAAPAALASAPGAAAFKPKKAPLMAKALQFMRGRKR